MQRAAGNHPILERSLKRPHVRRIIKLKRSITARRVGCGVIICVQILTVLAHDIVAAFSRFNEPEDIIRQFGVFVIGYTGKTFISVVCTVDQHIRRCIN